MLLLHTWKILATLAYKYLVSVFLQLQLAKDRLSVYICRASVSRHEREHWCQHARTDKYRHTRLARTLSHFEEPIKTKFWHGNHAEF
jgi:hypothetical protein